MWSTSIIWVHGVKVLNKENAGPPILLTVHNQGLKSDVGEDRSRVYEGIYTTHDSDKDTHREDIQKEGLNYMK